LGGSVLNRTANCLNHEPRSLASLQTVFDRQKKKIDQFGLVQFGLTGFRSAPIFLNTPRSH